MRVGLPPIALVGAVLGSIIGGIAAPTEAASMGALGSIVVMAMAGRFVVGAARDHLATTRITAIMMFILICAQVFALAFRGLHGERLVQDLFASCRAAQRGADLVHDGADLHPRVLHRVDRDQLHRGAAVPAALHRCNVDMVWVASLIGVNLQTSFLTPPFGWALFYLRGVAPPEVTTGDLPGHHSLRRMQLIALVLCFLFPGLALWLPKAIGW